MYKWITSGYQPGDIAIFDFGSGISHCGIFKSVISPGVYETVEGNTGAGNDTNGGAVMIRTRYNRHIKGACRYPFAGGEDIKKVLDLAISQVGITEYPPDSNKVKYNTKYYGREIYGDAYPWCAVFIWWVFTEAGYKLPVTTASCTALARSFGYGKIVANDVIHLQVGSTGAQVVALQNKLNSLGYPCGIADGDFGPKTKAAVLAFQKDKGLETDGIVGPMTWTALNKTEATPVTTLPTLKYGSTGSAVITLQNKLNSLNYPCGAADGDFGPKTKAAVIAFQVDHNLARDGVVGPLTWAALNSATPKVVKYGNISRNFSRGAQIELRPSQIKKIEYVHGLEPTEHIDRAHTRIGADITINANFFGMSGGGTTGYVTDEGKVLSAAVLSPWGFGFVDKKTPVFSKNNAIGAIDFLGGYPLLLKDGKVSIDTTEYGFSATSTARRGRTAIGMKADGTFVIISIADNDRSNLLTILQTANRMLSLGCVNAINLDGGGSSSWITPWNKYVTTRPLDGFLCIWLNDV